MVDVERLARQVCNEFSKEEKDLLTAIYGKNACVEFTRDCLNILEEHNMDVDECEDAIFDYIDSELSHYYTLQGVKKILCTGETLMILEEYLNEYGVNGKVDLVKLCMQAFGLRLEEMVHRAMNVIIDNL